MEWRLFPEGTIPEYTTPEWYAGRLSAPHLEEPGHRERLIATAEVIIELNPSTVVDLGAGDGGLLSLLQAAHISCWGYDLQQTNVDVAQNIRGVQVELHDIVNDFYSVGHGNGDVAVATEMLEHLIDPHGFVDKIAQMYSIVVASSPWHETPNNHYEFHTFCWDLEGYRNLFESNGFEVVNQFIVQGAQIITGISRVKKV